jgi:hypothetical protein
MPGAPFPRKYITPSEKEETAKVVFDSRLVAHTLGSMDTFLRIREATPSELLAERLEREAQRASNSPELAQDYRRQAEMLRAMAAIQSMPLPRITIH